MDPHFFADPDPESQNNADPADPDPKHWFLPWDILDRETCFWKDIF